MKNGRLGNRHYYVAVLLYCVLGLVQTAFAQCTAPPAPSCSCNAGCDQGEAHAQALLSKGYYECTYPAANVTITHDPGGGGNEPKYSVSTGFTGSNHSYCGTCEQRPEFETGFDVCEGIDNCQSACKDGCSYDGGIDVGFNIDAGGGITSSAGGMLWSPTGSVCGEEDPNMMSDPPDPDPCAETPFGEACLEPPEFCVEENCVDLPPPGGCSYGDPTLCVGNPPPPPAAPPPPERPPEDDPCATGTGTANGQNFGINVHCLEEPPCDPGDPGCEQSCEQNPNQPQCEEEGGFCEENPNHVDCQSFCENNPEDPLCEGEFCDTNPEHFLCEGGGDCGDHPDDPVCQSACEQVPPPAFCGGNGGNTCDTNPNDPVCQHCVLYPSDPVCEQSGNPCDENPDSDACTGAQVGGGATCEDRPACTGDVIACAILNQQWETRCAIEKFGDDGEEPEPIEGEAEDHFGEEEIGIGSFNTSGFLGGGGCPADTITFNFFGTSQSAPMLWCDILPWLGFLVVAAATVTGVRILGS